ncbi:uncharacterized protein LOC122857397 [Aphidius gifuensis]|uniref:uncharacterized protein LOC122857397 n=1 Tax=Aphidius gifuensis TaxID=684658 RepID=UPI001CDD09E1|nr:uncharacterized protein LOC122857397 [Aphidius gifuensis]
MRDKYIFFLLIKLLMMENVTLSSATIADETVAVIESIANITINTISNKNSTYFHSIWKIIDNYESILYELNHYPEINLQITQNLIIDYEKRINNYFERIQFLREKTEDWSKLLKKQNSMNLFELTKDMISNDDDYPRSTITKLHNKFLRRQAEVNFLYNHPLLQLKNKSRCEEGMSQQHKLYSFYNTILFAEVQSFGILAFSYMWRSINNKFDYIDEMMTDMSESKNRIGIYTESIKNEITRTSNFIRRCDPLKNHEKGKTYEKFDNLIYSLIINQKHFEPANNVQCAADCEDFSYTRRLCQLQDSDCSVDNHDYDNTCPGWIFDCKDTLSDAYEVCRRDHQVDKSSTKLYNWFKNKNTGLTYGDTNRTCSTREEIVKEKMSWYNPWSNVCKVCMCSCVDNRIHTKSNTIRAFSLIWSTTSENMVATGARLVAKDRMIHIQLREGKLLPYGKIDKNTERWVPLPTFKYKNNFPDEVIGIRNYSLIRGEHFVSVGGGYADNICFQKLILNDTHLLTGVRFGFDFFHKNQTPENRCFRLDAEYVNYNYQNGSYRNDRKYLYESFPDPLTPVALSNPDNPLKFKINMKDSEDHQFITIGTTDLIKDASQTFIPFIDLLEVTTNPSVPLNGIELFHKGQANGSSGGYISLKIYPVNLRGYL